MPIPTAEPSGSESNESALQFPSFMLLPYYVREQIWETAMGQVNFKQPRIHYYSLYNTDDQGVRHSELQNGPGIITTKSTPPPDEYKGVDKPEESDELKWSIQTTDNSIQRRPMNTTWARANRLRYYYSDSLLTACSESRFIYLRRFKKLFPGHQQLSLHVARGYDGHKEVYIHVDELRDILCLSFSPEDLEAAAAGLQWDVLLASMPFFSSSTIEVVNIAFEFGSSWNDNLPGSWESMRCEASPRGLCARALWAWAHGELPEKTRVWLIDRTWKPPPEYFVRWRERTTYMLPGDLMENRPKVIIDDRLVYMDCKAWRDDSPEFAASATALVWQFLKWYDDLRYRQTYFVEGNVISSWRNLSWNSPLCVAVLFEVPTHKVKDWFLFRPCPCVTLDT